MHDYDAMTEPKLRSRLSALAIAVGKLLPPETGFIVLATPFGHDQAAQYVANVSRETAAAWMLETVERLATADPGHVIRDHSDG